MVKALGYTVIHTRKRAQWDRFLLEVPGAMRAPSPRPGVSLFRVDERPFRFWIEDRDDERLAAAGYEVADADALAALAGRVEASGRPVERCSDADARDRGVRGVFRTSDPVGNGLEFYWGDSAADAPFASPAGVSGFVTGELGMGHAVFMTPEFEATHAFYRDVVGLGDTDLPAFHLMGPDAPPMRFAFMHGATGRHHCLALGEGPIPPSGGVHVMLEMKTFLDVGRAHDRMRHGGWTESATLGRHANDEMLGFYVRTPSGFDLEIGCDGLVIDPATWRTTAHEKISDWGHVWEWQQAMRKEGA